MESPSYFIIENYKKTKNKIIVCKSNLGSESRLRVEKVLTPPQCLSKDSTFNQIRKMKIYVFIYFGLDKD